MALYDRLADLPLAVEGVDTGRLAADTSSDFRRVTTVFSVRGGGETGRGEDVTYATADHEALADASLPDLTGEYTFGGFAARLDELELFPGAPPAEERFRRYRRWGVESAALDLALRQAGESLGGALDREYDPVRFVASTRLPDGAFDRVGELLAAYPDLELKLDPTPEWGEGLIDRLAATGAVRVLDLKAAYEDPELRGGSDPELYRTLFEAFPEAVVEDPAVTGDTRALVDANADRVSWDVPVTGVDSLRALPFEPAWLNVKPSRFGSVASLLATLEHCEREGIARYGGGQFELGPGRDQVQALASLFYPEAPNDVAPRGFNEPDVRGDLPVSPLAAPPDRPGFGSPSRG